jgi:hypothetical protein
MNPNLTLLILKYEKDRRRHDLLFGDPVSFREECGSVERHAFFAPGQLFGIEVWEANDYGTISWTIYVLRAVAPGETATPLRQVNPGAEILLSVRGKKKIRRAHAWLRSLSAANQSLSAIDPDWASHYRFQIGLAPRDLDRPNGKICF